MTTESNFNGIYGLLNLNILPYTPTVTLEDFQERIARGAESPPDDVVSLGRECAAGTCSDEDLLKRLCEALRLGASGIETQPNQPVPTMMPYPSGMSRNPPPPCPEALKEKLGTRCKDLDSCIRVLLERLAADFMYRWARMEDFEDLFSEDLGRVGTAWELLTRLNKLARRLGCKEATLLGGYADPNSVNQLAKCLVRKAVRLTPAELKQLLDEFLFNEDEIRWFKRHVHRGWDPLLRWGKDNLSPERLMEELKKINQTINPGDKPPVIPVRPNTPPPLVVPAEPDAPSYGIPGYREPPPWAYPGNPHSGG